MRVIINYLSISALRHKKQFSRKVADCWVSFQYRSFGSGGRAGHQPGRPGNEIQKLIILQIAPLKDCIRLRSASCAQTQSCMQTPTQLHRYIPYQQSLPITAFLEVLTLQLISNAEQKRMWENVLSWLVSAVSSNNRCVASEPPRMPVVSRPLCRSCGSPQCQPSHMVRQQTPLAITTTPTAGG